MSGAQRRHSADPRLTHDGVSLSDMAAEAGAAPTFELGSIPQLKWGALRSAALGISALSRGIGRTSRRGSGGRKPKTVSPKIKRDSTNDDASVSLSEDSDEAIDETNYFIDDKFKARRPSNLNRGDSDDVAPHNNNRLQAKKSKHLFHLIDDKREYFESSMKDQWQTTVEIMAANECSDPDCTDCQYPFSQNPRINCITAQPVCKSIRRKFQEHVLIMYYDHALQHVTVLVVCAYALLAAMIIIYTAGDIRLEYADTPVGSFSTYPDIALGVYAVCLSIDILLLGFLWGVQLQCFALAENVIEEAEDRKRQRQSEMRRNSGPFRSLGAGKGRQNRESCCPADTCFSVKKRADFSLRYDSNGAMLIAFCIPTSAFFCDFTTRFLCLCTCRAHEATRKHMQLFYLLALLPVLATANVFIFFLYFGKFQCQRAFFLYSFEVSIDNFCVVSTGFCKCADARACACATPVGG